MTSGLNATSDPIVTIGRIEASARRMIAVSGRIGATVPIVVRVLNAVSVRLGVTARATRAMIAVPTTAKAPKLRLG